MEGSGTGRTARLRGALIMTMWRLELPLGGATNWLGEGVASAGNRRLAARRGTQTRLFLHAGSKAPIPGRPAKPNAEENESVGVAPGATDGTCRKRSVMAPDMRRDPRRG